MKKILLITALFTGTLASAQITSTGDGNATNPFIWDCFCFPTPGDEVIINHDIVMNVDWLINAGGSITVNSGASFIEDVENRAILVDGAGSAFVNNGHSELTNMAFTNGASGSNSSVFLLDTALFIGATSTFNNSGLIFGMDSLLNNGTLDNSSGGSLDLGDFWNNGTFTNGGVVFSDSLLNTASFASTGAIFCYDFGNDGPFSQSGGDFYIEHNFYNADNITITSGTTVLVGNDMLSGDTLGGTASIVNDGSVGVANDFLNTDALSGSGRYCIMNSSTNTGAVTGTLDICDQSPGGGFDVNIGTIAGTVTNCASLCDVGVAEMSTDEILIYPNPTNAFFTIEFSNELGQLTYELYNLMGEVILSDHLSQTANMIDINSLSKGVYLCKISNEKGLVTTERVVKN